MGLLLFLEVASRGSRVDGPLSADLSGVEQKCVGEGSFPARTRASQQYVVDVCGAEFCHAWI